MENELTVVIEKSAVEQSTAVMLQDSFTPLFERAKAWKIEADKIQVTDISQIEAMQQARTIRLSLRDIRLQADKKRKELKEDSLRYGKAVQGVYNVIDYLITPIEKRLEEQEKFAENLMIRKQEELSNKRMGLLAPYKDYAPMEFNYGTMSEEMFKKILDGAKFQKEADDEKVRIAEVERQEKEKADEEARQQLKVENERLKKESERRDKMFNIGLKFTGDSFVYKDINFHWTDLLCMSEEEFINAYEGARKRKQTLDEEEHNERAKEKAIADKALADADKALADKKALEDKVLEDKRIADNKAKEEKALADKKLAEEKEALRKEQNAPDRDKIVKFISEINLMNYPDVKGEDAKKILEYAKIELGKVASQLSIKVSQI